MEAAFRFMSLIFATTPESKGPSTPVVVLPEQEEKQGTGVGQQGGRPNIANLDAPQKPGTSNSFSKRSLLQALNQLLSVCAHCADVPGALRAFKMARGAGLQPDTMLYTALITACCRAGQMDLAFKVQGLCYSLSQTIDFGGPSENDSWTQCCSLCLT